MINNKFNKYQFYESSFGDKFSGVKILQKLSSFQIISYNLILSGLNFLFILKIFWSRASNVAIIFTKIKLRGI